MVLYTEGVGASGASPGGEVRIRRRHQSGVGVRDMCPPSRIRLQTVTRRSCSRAIPGTGETADAWSPRWQPPS